MPNQETLMLDVESVEFIQNFINSKFDEDNLRERFPNPLLREDVLALLEQYCTAVFPDRGRKKQWFSHQSS